MTRKFFRTGITLLLIIGGATVFIFLKSGLLYRIVEPNTNQSVFDDEHVSISVGQFGVIIETGDNDWKYSKNLSFKTIVLKYIEKKYGEVSVAWELHDGWEDTYWLVKYDDGDLAFKKFIEVLGVDFVISDDGLVTVRTSTEVPKYARHLLL